MSIITRTDVSAIKIYGNCILAGIGSWINIFDRRSSKLTYKIHALNGQKVYGFILSLNNEILVYGGKQFTVMIRQDGDRFVKLFNAIICNDWLHAGLWTTDGCAVMLTAHNVVQKWDIWKKTLVTEYISKNNSILYSGLLIPIDNHILVFSGTVFSEVLINRCDNDMVLHRLKGHKGVIFSISCNLQKGVIVTTSDDRSVRIWQVHSTTCALPGSIEYWENVNISCIHELYGHLARVMRNIIKDNFVISIGEDSCICFWSYNGALLRKVTTHQNACIWSLDANDECLVTGGGDSAITLHPLSMVPDYGRNEIVHLETANAKKIVFTARRNIVVLFEKDDLIYYDVTKKLITKHMLKHESTYKLLSVSSCKQLIAVVDMFGNLDIFIENCKGPSNINCLMNTKLQIGKILFMQWVGNRHLIFSSENGVITVLSRDNNTEIYANFVIPPCKERWLTTAAKNDNMLVVGDRCGNLHTYIKSQKNPLKSFKKVHGRYGPTSINFRKNEIITTGRDGTVKYFCVNDCDVKLMYSKNLELQWVEKFADKDEHYICGFHERRFVVYDIRNSNKLFEVTCGGGHRSWDIIRYIDKVNDVYEEFMKFIYLKNSNVTIETFQLSKVVSKSVVSGTHSKEINCLRTHVCELDSSTMYTISGGEDTTLRISSISSDNEFQDEVVFKQLSSVKTVRLCALPNEKLLIISAGGRAQVCVKLIQFERDDDNKIKVVTEELCDYLLKGTDKERKGNQTWRNCSVDIDPETRIMDLDVVASDDNNFIIVAGCSDAYLRVFSFKCDGKNTALIPIQQLKHDTCILKTHVFQFHNKNILISTTTVGVATIWEIQNSNCVMNVIFNPLKTLCIHKSGINSIACKAIADDTFVLASGGDDNTINVNLIEMKESGITVKHSWSSSRVHCSQVTGLMFVDEYIVSTSIDQRVTLLRWEVREGVRCEFVSQVIIDVADVQGLNVLKHDTNFIKVIVFGKGFEILSLQKPSRH